MQEFIDDDLPQTPQSSQAHFSSTLPLWRPDNIVLKCPLCNREFTALWRRKHHCRNCGDIFCHQCSANRVNLPSLGYDGSVRVCDICFAEYNRTTQSGQEEISDLQAIKRISIAEFNKDADVKEWLLLICDQNSVDKLNKKVFQGVPNRLRATVWPQLAESQDLVSKNKGVYIELMQNKATSQYLDLIDSDVNRTFPDHPYFKESKKTGQRALSNILNCFTLLNVETGYCQGMNFIAGVLLIQMDEEQAFWLFVQLMKKYGLEGFFSTGTPKLAEYLQRFDIYIAKLLSKLHVHFKTHGIEVQIFASQWWRTLFSYNFPLELVFRIWDVFLVEGLDFLIWVGLVILEQCQEEILQMEGMGIMAYFKRLPDRALTSLSLCLNEQGQSKRFSIYE